MSVRVDLDINADETFEIELQYWDNVDRTLPIDISTWVFNGSMYFSGNLCIPMTFNIINTNTVNCRIEADQLVDLPSTGTYVIRADIGTDRVKLQEGKIRVNRNVVC